MLRRSILIAVLTLACDGPAAPNDASLDALVPREDAGEEPPFVEDPSWHRHVVFYELWVRSFQDSNGDGIGDLAGLTSRLDYLDDLGIGGLWLMPTYPSPLADSGYDVADYIGVHPDYGTLADMDAFLAEAHARGIRVYLDLVFNHTSTEHPWFTDSQADPSGEHGDWFVWSDAEGLACDGAPGPFGAVRWTRDPTRGQYYFHQFYPAQPDLSFDQPAMRDALLDVMRFWLERGVDGFRLDVPYRYDEDLPSCVHRPGTFDFLRQMRATLDEYEERSMVGEVLGGATTLASYLGDDVLQMVFLLGEAPLYWAAGQTGNASGLGRAMDAIAAVAPPGGTFATLIGNHDVPRATAVVSDAGALSTMAAAQLTLPGVPFVYYGEELGMLPGSGVIIDSRDSARTPMQWDASDSSGFTSGAPFLALAPEHDSRNVDVMSADPASILSAYRRLIALRNATPALRTGTYRRLASPNASTLAYWRRHPDGDRLVVVHFGRTTPTALDVELPIEWTGGQLYDELGRQSVGAIASGRFTAAIPPLTTWILRPE